MPSAKMPYLTALLIPAARPPLFSPHSTGDLPSLREVSLEVVLTDSSL